MVYSEFYRRVDATYRTGEAIKNETVQATGR